MSSDDIARLYQLLSSLDEKLHALDNRLIVLQVRYDEHHAAGDRVLSRIDQCGSDIADIKRGCAGCREKMKLQERVLAGAAGLFSALVVVYVTFLLG